MGAITILAVIGLFMWCGSLSRRTQGRMPADTYSTAEVESQMADLTEAYHRLETEMATRVTELEERLDFAERMLGEQKQRAYLGRSA